MTRCSKPDLLFEVRKTKLGGRSAESLVSEASAKDTSPLDKLKFENNIRF